MNEFTEARVKLTLQYIVISFILLTVFTLAAISAELRAFNRIETAITSRGQRPAISAFLETRIREFSKDYVSRLFVMDAVLLVFASGVSWYLSGQTLKPIEEMVKKQEEFSADASHELRTPLTTMAMEIEALKRTDNRIPGRYGKVFDSIGEEITRMKLLVDGLLTLVRTDHAPVFTDVALNEILHAAAAKVKPLADEKRLQLTVKSGPAVRIRGDADSMARLIVILLENAIKYTPRGSVEAGIRKHGTHAEITVKDTGIGIPPKDMPRIFERFYRVDIGAHKGTGLGLAIAKKIVSDHGGKITAESRTGQGSVFTVMLPLAS